MNSNKRTAKIAGALIIVGMVAGILSIVPAVEGTDYLIAVFPNRNQVLTGALFQFLLVPIYIGFSLLLYQTVKQSSKSLAVGFVGFRFVAGAFQLIGVILLPIFIYLSQEYLSSGPSSSVVFLESFGAMLKLFRDLANHLGVMVATGLGNLLLYSVFLRGKHIPKWLSIWGIIGNSLIIIASFFILFQLVEVVSSGYIAMTIPLVIQELVLAIWLIAKGLKLPLENTQSTK